MGETTALFPSLSTRHTMMEERETETETESRESEAETHSVSAV